MDGGAMDGLFVPQEWDNLVRGRSGILSDGGGGCKGTGLACASAQRDRGGRHADGQVPTPSKKRRTAGEGDRTDAKALPKGGVQAAGEPCMHSAARTTDEVCNSIMQGLNRNQMTQGGGQEDGDVEMRLDHVLSRIPYKDMLRDLFDQCKEVDCPQIPVVTRRYEETFMREAKDSSERQCVMGAECECNFIDRSNPFVGVEFTVPNQVPSEDRHMCVLCHRRFVQSLFHEMIYNGKEIHGVIQRYGNICGCEGEYAKEVAMICPPNGPTHCMPFPAISHQRNRYKIVARGGVRYLVQCRMSPQDFC